MTSPEATRTRWERFQLKVNLNSSDQNRLRTILQGSGNEVGSRLKRLSPKPPSLEASQPRSSSSSSSSRQNLITFYIWGFLDEEEKWNCSLFFKKNEMFVSSSSKVQWFRKKKKNGRNLIWVKIKQASLRRSILDSLSAFGFSRLGDLRILNRLQNSSLAKVYKLVSFNIFFS